MHPLISILTMAAYATALAGCAADEVAGPNGSQASATQSPPDADPEIIIGGERYVMVSLDDLDLREEFADTTRKPAAATANPNWPNGYQLEINITLAKVAARNYRRPYVAIWIEDGDRKVVRLITVWRNEIKYQRTLRDWWQQTKKAEAVLVDAITRPTRPPGEFKMTWDGLSDAGKPVAAGDYTVHIEIVREHGTHVHMKKAIACGKDPKTEKIDGNLEVDGVVLKFGPMKAP